MTPAEIRMVQRRGTAPDVAELRRLLEDASGVAFGSQRRLAALVGCTPWTIRQWERGVRPSPAYFLRLAEVERSLKCSTNGTREVSSMTRCAVDYGEVVAGILGGGNSSIPPELDEAFRGRAFFFALYFEGLRAVADLRARGTRLVFEDWPRSVADAFELAVNGRKIKFEREDRKAVVSILRDGFNSEVVSYGSRRESIVVPKTMSDYRDLAQQHIKAAVELLFRGL